MRARGHLIVGAIAGAALNTACQLAAMKQQPGRQFDVSQAAACAAIGAAAGLIPDLLEPAVHPHHRQFWHSAAAGAAVSWLLCGRHTQSLPIGFRLVLWCATAGYLSHLVVDALTPRSIRFF